MQFYVFKGSKDRVFAFTPDNAGANLSAPDGPWSPFKTLEMNRGEEHPRGAVKSDECLDDIEKYGFHITETHVRITESVTHS